MAQYQGLVRLRGLWGARLVCAPSSYCVLYCCAVLLYCCTVPYCAVLYCTVLCALCCVVLWCYMVDILCCGGEQQLGVGGFSTRLLLSGCDTSTVLSVLLCFPRVCPMCPLALPWFVVLCPAPLCCDYPWLAISPCLSLPRFARRLSCCTFVVSPPCWARSAVPASTEALEFELLKYA